MEILSQNDGFVGAELLRFRKEQIYCVYDEETEGLSGISSRPWQISFMLFTLDKIITTHDYYIWWPDLSISEDAKRITRFNYETYKYSAKPLEEVRDIFEKYYLDNSIIKTGHNIINFDSGVWNTARKSLGLPPVFEPSKYSIDTLALARAYRLGVKPLKFTPGNLEWLKFQVKMLGEYGNRKMKVSLGALAKEFGIQTDENRLHEALYDIGINREVFRSLLWKLEI